MTDSQVASSGHKARKSRRRWLWGIGLFLVLPVLAAGIGHAWWGHRAEQRYLAAMARYRAVGPSRLADLADPSVPDEQNAVADLRAAAAVIDEHSAVWEAFVESQPIRLPLPAEHADLLNR